VYEVSTLPIWAQPAPATRKPRFTRDQIAAAAISIADRDGFADLSMRRVADALGAGTMTLYYYIRTKDDLLALMADALMAEVVERSTPLPAHWRAALEVIAGAMRETFSRHTWALSALEGARLGGPNTLRHIEHSLAAVSTLNVPAKAKFELLSIVDDYVFGTVQRDHNTDAETGLRGAPKAAAKTINALATKYLAEGEFPHLEALIGGRQPIEAFVEFASSAGAEGRFERGLAMILDGFSARYKRLTGRPARTRRSAEIRSPRTRGPRPGPV
jgi:AcrR family transcriptional regulator